MSHAASRWNTLTGSLIGDAFDRAEQLRAEGREILDLTSGEPDFATPDNVMRAAHGAIDDGITKYTATDGARELKQAIQLKYCRDNGLDFTLDEICVGSGAKSILHYVLMAILDDTDEVIVPVPGWASFPGMVELCGAKPVLSACTVDDGYKLSAQALAEACSSHTKALVINSPGNPTGAVYAKEHLRALAEVLEDYPRVIVVADEIYEHLVYDAPFTAFASAVPSFKDRCVSVNGVSKAYAMTGWRIGYAAGPLEIMDTVRKLLSHGFGGSTSISQVAAVEALRGPQDGLNERVGIYRARRDRSLSALNQTPGLSVNVPEGAFYLYVDCTGTFGQCTKSGELIRTSDDFCRWLLDTTGVASVPSSGFYCDGAFRISFACADAVLDEAVRRIVEFTNSLH